MLAAVLFIGGWLGLSSPSGTGSENVTLASAPEGAAEQSLRSLDSAANPQGAPGSTLEMPGAHMGAAAASGASGAAGGQSGSLYEAPGAAAGSPIPAGAGEAIEAAARGQRAGSGGASLADALRGVAAGAGKVPDNGWGGAPARSGFAKPRAEFG
ncbi:MAG: hypothetical protein HYV15_03730, partial [Elusimicrobia bacterium]|nr:hypothetical protein [Elusimicrobiota bacterium]